MPVYEYHCDANGKTVEVSHDMNVTLSNWGELCYVAQMPFGDTPVCAPVRRLMSAPAVHVQTGAAELKGLGFTKLVKRDDGVYENVTATGSEQRYVKPQDPKSWPHLHKKVED
jgi:predicted nucleic acid-binding Zn ribbon protein